MRILDFLCATLFLQTWLYMKTVVNFLDWVPEYPTSAYLCKNPTISSLETEMRRDCFQQRLEPWDVPPRVRTPQYSAWISGSSRTELCVLVRNTFCLTK